MSAPLSKSAGPEHSSPAPVSKSGREIDSTNLDDARESITWFRHLEDGEEDRAPLHLDLLRRIASYTGPYQTRRNWLLFLTFARGLQLPILAWMIGQTINGPIASQDLRGIYPHAAHYLALVLFMIVTLNFRQRFVLDRIRGNAHEMRSELFIHLTSHLMSFFNKTRFGRIISRLTSD